MGVFSFVNDLLIIFLKLVVSFFFFFSCRWIQVDWADDKTMVHYFQRRLWKSSGVCVDNGLDTARHMLLIDCIHLSVTGQVCFVGEVISQSYIQIGQAKSAHVPGCCLLFWPCRKEIHSQLENLLLRALLIANQRHPHHVLRLLLFHIKYPKWYFFFSFLLSAGAFRITNCPIDVSPTTYSLVLVRIQRILRDFRILFFCLF